MDSRDVSGFESETAILFTQLILYCGAMSFLRISHFQRFSIPILLMIVTLGCTAFSGSEGTEALRNFLPSWTVQKYAKHDMAVMWAESPHLEQTSSRHIDNAGKPPILVFIEGDGRAWSSRSVRAANPSPTKPVAAQLANLTAGSNAALYLARPCQFFDDQVLAGLKQCKPKLWTDERYNAETIALLSEVLDEALGPRSQPLVLVGYSGGGVIAAVLAAQRDDVVGLITVAANLSVDTWTVHHRVSPLRSASLPTDYAAQLGEIPQYHLLGIQDTVVPKIVHDAYLAALIDLTRVKTVYVDGYDHSCCWPESWLDHLHQALAYFNDNSHGVGVTSHE